MKMIEEDTPAWDKFAILNSNLMELDHKMNKVIAALEQLQSARCWPQPVYPTYPPIIPLQYPYCPPMQPTVEPTTGDPIPPHSYTT